MPLIVQLTVSGVDLDHDTVNFLQVSKVVHSQCNYVLHSVLKQCQEADYMHSSHNKLTTKSLASIWPLQLP